MSRSLPQSLDQASPFLIAIILLFGCYNLAINLLPHPIKGIISSLSKAIERGGETVFALVMGKAEADPFLKISTIEPNPLTSPIIGPIKGPGPMIRRVK
jgi:hypothetical protein